MSTIRPQFRSHVHAHVVDPELVILLSEAGIDPLEGRLFALLAPLLTGELTVPQMIAQLEDALDPLDVIYGVEVLRRKGALADEAAEPAAIPLSEERPADVAIVLTDDYLDPELAEVNRDALASGKPWILARPSGRVVWVGPRFEPGRGPCWECLAMRMREALAAWGVAGFPRSEGRVGNLTAARVGEVITFDLESGAVREHAVMRRSDCRACGTSPSSAFGTFSPRGEEKGEVADEGRSNDTYTRYAHLISPLLGIVHSVERIPGDTPIYAARHNFGRHEKSFGKGKTDAQARTGALCEALERHCGHFRGDEPRVRATYRELAEEAIHPNDLLGFSDRQYAERDRWNALNLPRIWVPERFDEKAAIEWTPARSLVNGRTRYVPTAYCYYGLGGADSNGNAAGETLDDAILNGLLELVERDAVAIWWYNRVKRPAVSSAEKWVLDLTTDLDIPVFAAISHEHDVIMGFGAHHNAEIAIEKAIAEWNQAGATSRGRSFSGDIADRSFLEPHSVEGRCPQRPIAAHHVWAAEGGGPPLRHCVGLLRDRGFDVLVVDQTRADVGLAVVKVIVPGLRHFRPRFAPGRLYDVPPRLGWLERPLREDELNPAHLLI